jgi:hypothetical protein
LRPSRSRLQFSGQLPKRLLLARSTAPRLFAALFLELPPLRGTLQTRCAGSRLTNCDGCHSFLHSLFISLTSFLRDDLASNGVYL